ncbi:MAG: TetR/AcrR family transcriptional regulator [Jatrophihabitantaceae bacterium]
MTTDSAPRGVRARVREELSREIREAARRQLAQHGSAELSLRAVARELGMVSSAVYRYYPSRDELLTALIIDAYQAVGAAAEQAEAEQRRADFAGRWLALARGARGWAIEHPQEYALIFGSPVPGYQAPPDTVDPAARIPLLMLAILADAHQAGQRAPGTDRPLPRSVRSDLKALRAQIGAPFGEQRLARAVMAWTQLIGSISFELFGHLKGSVVDYSAYFDYQMGRIGHELGL